MSLDTLVNVTINLAEPPIPLANFGIPLIAAILTAPQGAAWDTAYGASVETAEVTPSTWQTVMATLGVTSSEDLYVALLDLFSQEEQPERVIIGRRATPVAQVERIEITGSTDGDFTVTVDGVDFTYTASSDTPTAIEAALIAAINLPADETDPDFVPVTAAPGPADNLDLTADLAGASFQVSVTNANAELSIVQQTASVGIPEDIVTWRAERDDWYFLLETTRETGNIRSAALATEPLTKMLYAQTNDAQAQGAGALDIGSKLGSAGQNLLRTVLFFDTNDDQFVDAAIVGKIAPKDPGTYTEAAQSLRSVVGFVPTGEANLLAKKYNFLELFSAQNLSLTRGGFCINGQFADLVRARDWLKNLIQIRCLEALRDNDKVDYDEPEELEGAVRGALEEAASLGVVDPQSIVVNLPDSSTQSPTDRGNRHLAGLTFGATLVIGVHSLDITGNLA